MGVKIEYLFHKDMSFNEMIPKIAEAYRKIVKENEELGFPAFEVCAPIPFLERMLQTGSRTVIHEAVMDLLNVLTEFKTVNAESLKQLTDIANSNKLDEIDAIAKKMIVDCEKSFELASTPSSNTTPWRKHVFSGDKPTFSYRAEILASQDDASGLERRPMIQADLSRIHALDYVDDGWRREIGPDGFTGYMVKVRPNHPMDPILAAELAKQTPESPKAGEPQGAGVRVKKQPDPEGEHLHIFGRLPVALSEETKKKMQDLLDSRDAAKELLSKKQEPTTPMDIAAAKVLKAHSDAGTLESVSDEQLAQQVSDQYFEDWERSLPPQDGQEWDRNSPEQRITVEEIAAEHDIDPSEVLDLRGVKPVQDLAEIIQDPGVSIFSPVGVNRLALLMRKHGVTGYIYADGQIALTDGRSMTTDELIKELEGKQKK